MVCKFNGITGPAPPHVVRSDLRQLVEIVSISKMDSDQLVDYVYLYLTEGIYPSGVTVNQKRSIRKKARKFKMLNGELFYLNGRSCKSKVNVNDMLYRCSNINILQTPVEVRYIRNKEEQQRILKACHLDPT